MNGKSSFGKTGTGEKKIWRKRLRRKREKVWKKKEKRKEGREQYRRREGHTMRVNHVGNNERGR